jgi:hypothetical protein
VSLTELLDLSNPQLELFFTSTAADGLNAVFGSDLKAGDTFGFAAVSPQFAAIPEPETWLLMILGVALVGSALRRRAALAA